MRKRKASTATWQNRIVRTGTRPAREFVAHPDNYRVHPHAQEAALVAILDRIGWVQDVVVSARTGYTLDGHLRVLAALRKGDDEPVPYAEIDVTEHEEALVLASLDPIAALAKQDEAKYAELVDLLPDDLRTLADAARGERLPTETKVEFTARVHHRVIVECADEAAAVALHDRLVQEGYTCQLKS